MARARFRTAHDERVQIQVMQKKQEQIVCRQYRSGGMLHGTFIPNLFAGARIAVVSMGPEGVSRPGARIEPETEPEGRYSG